MVRVGFPGWKLWARLGLPVSLRVAVHFDDECKSFWADSPDLRGLVIAGVTPGELLRDVNEMACVLIELELGGGKRSHGAVVTKPRLAMSEPVPA